MKSENRNVCEYWIILLSCEVGIKVKVFKYFLSRYANGIGNTFIKSAWKTIFILILRNILFT